MINIITNSSYPSERAYILKVVFTEFFNIDFIHQIDNSVQDRWVIKCNKSIINIPDILFSFKENEWLTKKTLPQRPLYKWHSTIEKSEEHTELLPIIYGVASDNKQFDIPIDIFGSAFFMLTRYEEVVNSDKADHFNRFPAKESVAYQENFLHRPIINEYLELLWKIIHRSDLSLVKKKHIFEIIPSYDVDNPFLYYFKSLTQIFRFSIATSIRSKNPLNGVNHIIKWFRVKILKKLKEDPYNTFDFLMQVSESLNLKSRFYFITDKTSKYMCGDYVFNNIKINKIMTDISTRGHSIGLHPSFNTYTNASQIKRELNLLKSACKRLHIPQNVWGGRQHILRWKCPDTWQFWENAGLDYDSTLSFADYSGFRAGVCFEYSTFNLLTKQQLKLKELPLIVMECSVISPRYMNLGWTEKSVQHMLYLKQQCQKFNGKFTLLWHNSFFDSPHAKSIYWRVLSE